MLHRRDGFAASVLRLTGGLVADQLFARDRMLALGEPLEVLLTNLAGQTPPVREVSVPLATNQIPFAVVVLTRVLEFFFVITAGLSGAQRLRDREHGLELLEERLLPGSQRRRPFVSDDRLGDWRLNDRCGRPRGCRGDGRPSLCLDD